MRLTQAIEAINKKTVPSKETFQIKYTHINRDEIIRVRKKLRQEAYNGTL